jgi:predicted DNA repair protein MutK
MAGSSLFALLDDIASVLDDISLLTKVAAKKTSGVLGDDLALNAEQVSGVSADRELPVVWAVAKGSMVNKAILVPLALAISSFAPWAVTPLLMIGGLYLCFEGVEKLAHKYLHDPEELQAEQEMLRHAISHPEIDLVAIEKDKIKGAIRTDFVLSAEIVTIALGTVASEPFTTRLGVLTGLSALMTVGVYGLVAGIVKLDDLGLHLTRDGATRMAKSIGLSILKVAPYLMKTLSIAGTVAMFLVGGGIITHGIAPVHHFIEHTAEKLQGLSGIGSTLHVIVPTLLNAVAGIVSGAIALLLVMAVKRVWPRKQAP